MRSRWRAAFAPPQQKSRMVEALATYSPVGNSRADEYSGSLRVTPMLERCDKKFCTAHALSSEIPFNDPKT